MLKGLRATKDGIQAMDGLPNVNVDREAYIEYVEVHVIGTCLI